MIAIGIDPSSNGGAAWATLRVEHHERVYLDHGDCESEIEIVRIVRGAADVVGIEVPVGGLGTKRGDDAGSRKRGEHLIRAASVGHFMRGFVTGAEPGTPVIALPSWAARKHLSLGGRAPSTDAEVERALRVVVPSWPGPRKTTNHHRDAAAVAFAAAMVAMTAERRASGT